jgi:hypothetical protein
MKKIVVFFVILLVLTVTVFFAGWVQFSVPPQKYGVLVSRTGGVNPAPIVPARFRWQWEKLIPTNASILVFDLSPFTTSVSAEGILPSGEIYSKMLEGNPDFSWTINLKVTARVHSVVLPDLVSRLHIKNQSDLDTWTKEKINSLVEKSGRTFISDAMKSPQDYNGMNSDPAQLSEKIRQLLSANTNNEIDLISVTADRIKFPDLSLYAVAEKTYLDYQDRRNKLLEQASATEARDSVSEYLQIERFARWGEVLTKYPVLIDFLAVARTDSAEAFKAIKNLH